LHTKSLLLVATALAGLGVGMTTTPGAATTGAPVLFTFRGSVSRTIAFRLTRPAIVAIRPIPSLSVFRIVGSKHLAVRSGQLFQSGSYRLAVEGRNWTITVRAITPTPVSPATTPTTSTVSPTVTSGCPPGYTPHYVDGCCAGACIQPVSG
jgi:hypothetical protein